MWCRILSFVATLELLASSVTASTLTPPVLPLIVRNPYLSTWLGNARDVPWSKWPMFWTGQEIGFSVLAAQPDSHTVYPLLGRPHDSLARSGHGHGYNVSFPVYGGAHYDASVTNLTYIIPSPHSNDAEPLTLTLSFLSPITPTSTLRQSIPASYISVHVIGAFDLDVYIDINGQWVSGDRESEIVWSYNDNVVEDVEVLKTWEVTKRTEAELSEYADRAEWGTLYFSGPPDVHYECGTSALLRQKFARTGKLQNAVDTAFRGIMEEEPVFAFSKSFKLGPSQSSNATATDSVRFTLAHVQDPVVQYASARGLTYMRPLWKSWFPSDKALLMYHYLDFPHAQELARNYSAQLALDAFESGSDSYVDIVALSARQTMGGTTFAGTPGNPILFMKEISSDGNCQTVDVIFPSFPFFLYTNPRWLAYLLEPLLEHQGSGQYPNKYSMHDLGSHFPNVTGHPDGRDEYMPVEECGDMLIMGLALLNSLSYGVGQDPQSIWSAIGSEEMSEMDTDSIFPLMQLESRAGIDSLDDRWGGETKGAKQAQKWLRKHYDLWRQWTGYLVEFSLEPHNQLSTDDFAGWLALQTNLALKGIIGIKAMSEMASVIGLDADHKYFKNISHVYIKKWEEYGISRDGTHAKLAYDWYGSWTTLYSLYADAVLCFHPSLTNSTSSSTIAEKQSNEQQPMSSAKESSTSDDFIPSRVYKMQSTWYAAVMQKYGLPLDSRHLYTKSDWEFEAAAVTSKTVRADILHRVARWVNETATDRPQTDLYHTEGDGGWPGPHFFARPVVGGHFAFLALERACGGKAMEGLAFLDEE